MARTVMAFGSFDILHPGHVLYLERARRLGDRLLVVVARDSSIEMFKGRKPFFTEKERLHMVSALRVVDKAVLGNRVKDPSGIYGILGRYKPDVIALGYDQRADIRGLKEWLRRNRINASVKRLRARADPARYKSSIIRERLVRRS